MHGQQQTNEPLFPLNVPGNKKFKLLFPLEMQRDTSVLAKEFYVN